MTSSDGTSRTEIRDLHANPEQFSLFIQVMRNFTGDICPVCNAERIPPCLCGLSIIEPEISKEASRIVKNVKAEDWPADTTESATAKFKTNIKAEAETKKTNATQERWEKAAAELRIPYWNRLKSVPSVLFDATLTIAMPNGSTITVGNIMVPGVRDKLPSSAMSEDFLKT